MAYRDMVRDFQTFNQKTGRRNNNYRGHIATSVTVLGVVIERGSTPSEIATWSQHYPPPKDGEAEVVIERMRRGVVLRNRDHSVGYWLFRAGKAQWSAGKCSYVLS